MPDSVPQRSAADSLRTLYVRALLRFLPSLLKRYSKSSDAIKAEVDYLSPRCTFLLNVENTNLSGACMLTEKGFERIPPDAIARDVEPGSGLKSSDPNAITIDYVITFRCLYYAYDCFTGHMTLKSALAQRAFATRGPNDIGVSLTYAFTALLKIFFGRRDAYRSPNYANNQALSSTTTQTTAQTHMSASS